MTMAKMYATAEVGVDAGVRGRAGGRPRDPSDGQLLEL
jgi:hypothetical protein